MKPGETALDLGSGAGFDCFLAARQVGPSPFVKGSALQVSMPYLEVIRVTVKV